MALFRCILSNQTVEFIHEVDIQTTRANPAYEEIVEVEVVEEPVVKKTPVKKSTKVEE